MNTFIYFASGTKYKGYEKLGYDKVFLIDYFFSCNGEEVILDLNKRVTRMGYKCLEAVEWLKSQNIKIDCFVSLNEGLGEGGGMYPINSDVFLGYVLPLLKDNYIHIMSKDYYRGFCRISMDFTYEMTEVQQSDSRYISPAYFSELDRGLRGAKVYLMNKSRNESIEYTIKPGRQLKIIHDTIWRYVDQLDQLYISFTDQYFKEYFGKRPKVSRIQETSISEILTTCENEQLKRIGLTPWAKGKYDEFLDALTNHQGIYPKEVSLFHLNKSDYRKLKERLACADGGI